MNDRAHIEIYLDQKVNPLLEELLTNVIKNKPKNVVKDGLLSSTTVGDGSKKNQKICKCFPSSQTAILKTKIAVVSTISSREKTETNGTSNAKEYVDNSMAVTIYGSNFRCPQSKENQQSTAVFCLDWNHCFYSKISMTMISIDSSLPWLKLLVILEPMWLQREILMGICTLLIVASYRYLKGQRARSHWWKYSNKDRCSERCQCFIILLAGPQ